MDITQIFFMTVMIALYTSQNFFCKKFSGSYPGKSSDATPVLTIIGGIVVVLVSFFFSGCTFFAKTLTIILGLVNAFALYGYNYFILKGSESGPYSVLMVFAIAGGILFPSVAKWIWFGERMTGPAICFLLLVIVSVYFMSIKPNSNTDIITNRITAKFLLYALGLGTCNGIYGTMLAVQQEITGVEEKEELVMVTFAVAALISAVSLILKKSNIKKAMTQTKKSAAFLLIYAFSAAFAVNSLVIIMLFDIDTGVLYTIENAGVMLATVVLSLICFKEKLTKINVLGCILMSIGLIGITIFEKTTFSQIPQTLISLF